MKKIHVCIFVLLAIFLSNAVVFSQQEPQSQNTQQESQDSEKKQDKQDPNANLIEFRLIASENIGSKISEEEEIVKYEAVLSAGFEEKITLYHKSLLEKGYRWAKSREEGKKGRLLWIQDGYDFTSSKFIFFKGEDFNSIPALLFKTKEEAKDKLANFTRMYKGETFAIVLDNEVILAPIIQTEIRGEGVITGLHSEDFEKLKVLIQKDDEEQEEKDEDVGKVLEEFFKDIFGND